MKRLWVILVFLGLCNALSFAVKPGYKFIINHGQFHENVLFKAEIPSGNIFAEKSALTYHLYDAQLLQDLHHSPEADSNPNQKMQHHAFKMQFVDANPSIVEGKEKYKHWFNYYLGNNPEKWAKKVPAFGEVQWQSLYNGIDMRLYTSENQLKYDFIVNPGSNPDKIKWKYSGLENITVRKRSITLNTSLFDISENRPFAYQLINGEKIEVKCFFKELEDGSIGFEFPNGYNRSEPLIIDPTLIFSTYSGSTANNFGYSATFDARGYLYSASTVFDNGYPTTMGAFQTSWAGGTGGGPVGFPTINGTDIAITKWDTNGTAPIYSTYIGGSGDELPHSLVVNDNQELYLMGTTGSIDYPVIATSYDTSFNIDTNNVNQINLLAGLGVFFDNGSDLVISRFDSSGNNLLGSTFLGGTHNDGLNDGPTKFNYADEVRGEIAIDNNQNVVIVTCTRSNDIPIAGSPFQGTKPGPTNNLDAAIFKINYDLTSLTWSSYLGGNAADGLYSVAFDDQNRLYVSGGTSSNNFPMTAGVVDTSQNGGIDAFVSLISENGSNIIHSTYWGSNDYDQSYFVETDDNDDVYIFGQTSAPSSQLITNAQYNIPAGGQFITKLSPQLDSIIWSTRFGSGDGDPDISPTAFLVDLCSAVYLSGWGSSIQGGSLSTNGLPTAGNPIQSTTDGNDFYLMQLADDASSLDYATFMGGSASEHVDGGTSRFDKKGKIYQAVCAGCATASSPPSSDFPTHPNPGAHSTTNNANGCNLAVFKIDFLLPLVVADFLAPDQGCAPFTVDFENVSLQQSATNFYWDFDDGDTSNLFEPIHTFDSAGVYNVMLVLSDTASCNLNDTLFKEITVSNDTSYTLPTVTKCINEEVKIGPNSTPIPGISYNWSPSQFLLDTTIPRTATTVPFDFTYELIIDNGVCPDTVFQPVEVDSVKIELPNDTLLCDDQFPFNLSGNSFGTGNQFVWSSDLALTDTLNTVLTDSTFQADSANTYYFTAISSNDCQLTDSVEVLSVQQQNPLITGFDDPGIGCIPYDINFNNTSTHIDSAQFFWDFGTGDTSMQVNPSYQFSNSGTFTIQLVALDTGICTQIDTTELQIEVIEPVTENVADTGCLNSTIQIGSQSEPNTTYSWVESGLVSDPNASSTSVQLNSDTTLTLLATSVCVDTLYNSIKIDSVSANTDSLIISCSDQNPVQVNGTAQGDNPTFQWDTLSNFANPISTQQALTYSAERGVNKLYFKATTAFGCEAIDSTSLVVSDLTVKTEGDSFVCFNDTAQLFAENLFPQNQLSFSWEPIETIITPTDSQRIVATPTTTTSYIVTSINDSGCVGKDTATIDVSSLNQGVMSALASQDTILKSQTVDLLANPDTSIYSYAWSPEDVLVSNGLASVIAQPQQTTTFEVAVTDSQYPQCSDRAEVTVVVEELICGPPDIYVPNAFTPDSDGLNDELLVRGENIRDLTFKIYNRWGELVFETTNQQEGWDGIWNDSRVENGVYVYHLDLICIDGQEYFEKGNVTILK
jgi:gliding motility-associated-like protein